MNFIDKATVTIKAGNGGDGRVSFRQEKFIDRGGPDGGDGGNGGSVVFVASRNENTLAEFRFQKELQAEHGGAGGDRNKHGKNGEDLLVKVPIGTVVTDENGKILADLTVDGQQEIVAKGGKGGFGNAHFISSRRQAPKFAEMGEPGDATTALLELKMIADVGLIGLPNAGKSTLLSVISNARPEIADYPFTTIKPNLGVVDVDKYGMLFADIPGLIEGAATGKGLGDEFLRHVERTAVLVHLIDCYNDDVVEAYKTIREELAAYKIDLSKKPEIVVLTKIEGLDDEMIQDQIAALRKVVSKGTEVVAISAPSKKGLSELLWKVKDIVKAERAKRAAEEPEEAGLPVLTVDAGEDVWNVEKQGDLFVIHGTKIERFAARTNFDNDDGVQRLRHIMLKLGIMHELRRQGINAGDSIQFGNRPNQIKY